MILKLGCTWNHTGNFKKGKKERREEGSEEGRPIISVSELQIF